MEDFRGWQPEGRAKEPIENRRRIGSSGRPEPGDDYRVRDRADIAGLANKDDNPILIAFTKEKAGILGSGLVHLRLVAGVRFELTTFGL
jgi:hypothetical protein